MNFRACFLGLFTLVCFCNAFLQEAETGLRQSLSLAPLFSRSLTESLSSYGPTVAFEVTPIENRLELEAGLVHHMSNRLA